jgi:hypothetical protein
MSAPVPLPQGGGCTCGKVRFELTAAPLLAYACHCHGCQTRSGAAFSLTLVVRSADVAITGEPEFTLRRNRSGREIDDISCPACGTPVLARARVAPDFTSLRAGTLDDAGWVRPISQSFVEEAIPWAIIPDVAVVPWPDFDFAEQGVLWQKTAPAFVRG